MNGESTTKSELALKKRCSFVNFAALNGVSQNVRYGFDGVTKAPHIRANSSFKEDS